MTTKNTSLALLAIAVIGAANAQDLDQSALRAAEDRGRQIYLHDHAVVVVSDAAQPLFTEMVRQHLRGYITEEKGGAIVVTYYGTGEGGRLVAWYRGAVGPDGRLLGKVSQYEIPQALSEFEERAAAARETGMHYKFRPCAQNYNSVVLPKPGGWQVYLIAGTTDNNVVPFGGTYRIDLDASGHNIVADRGFTKSCLTLSTQTKAGEKPVAIVVSHLLDPQPTEVHVFWQLWSRQQWYVGTTQNNSAWRIEKGQISYTGKIDGAK